MNLDKSKTFQDFLFQVFFPYFWVLRLYELLISLIDCGCNWPHHLSKHYLGIEWIGPNFISYTCTHMNIHTHLHICARVHNTDTQRKKLGPALMLSLLVLFSLNCKRFCVGQHSWCLLTSILQQSSSLLITVITINIVAMPTCLPRSTKVLALSTAQACTKIHSWCYLWFSLTSWLSKPVVLMLLCTSLVTKDRKVADSNNNNSWTQLPSSSFNRATLHFSLSTPNTTNLVMLHGYHRNTA